MNIRFSSLVLVLALAVASGNSHAQDLESYKKKYQDALDRITAHHAQQVESITKTYSVGLNTLKERVQAAGDLNKLKAVLAEISRFEKDQTFPTEESKPIPEVLTLVKGCQSKIAAAHESKAQRTVALASQYDKALLRLQQESTRKGELDKATAIQEERKILAETETLTAARALLAEASKARPSRPSPRPTPKPVTRRKLNDPDKGWTKLFRGSGPSIWNTDTNVGEDSYAVSLDKAPEGIQFLRMKLVETGEFIIIPMNNESLGKNVNLGGYSWAGAKDKKNGHIYLGIGNHAWGAAYRNGKHCSIRGKRGWGWGTSPPGLTYPGAAFSWKGEKQDFKVIEISVKTDKLTIPEKNKMLK